MKQVKYLCDCCGDETTKEGKVSYPEGVYWRSWRPESIEPGNDYISPRRVVKYLCTVCAKRVLETINHALALATTMRKEARGDLIICSMCEGKGTVAGNEIYNDEEQGPMYCPQCDGEGTLPAPKN